MNKEQKTILAILLPVILFVLFIPILDNFDGYTGEWEQISASGQIKKPDLFKPLEFQKTWSIWLIYIILLSVLEFLIFNNKKNN